MILLGIESSCDETAAAVVKDTFTVLSSVIASQVDVHQLYGGVVPELASRMHLEAVTGVVDQAIRNAGISIKDIDAVAATRGPGLIGALLVGFSFAKAFAHARHIPLAGVNHLEAHIYSLLLTDHPPEFPFVALVVSGGHTNIYHVISKSEFVLMGQTRDDAAGEAFDKVAKMMDLGYPGGPVIERLAKNGTPDIPFPRPMLDREDFDFSFSGIKSAVARYVHENGTGAPEDRARIAASFQAAVIDVISDKLIRAAAAKGCPRIGIAGGVSANQTLVNQLTLRAREQGITVFHPPVSLCSDNAAMIAARGSVMIANKELVTDRQDVFSRIKI